MQEILKVKNIGKKYQAKNGEIIAIDNVSFNIYSGEFVSVIGPSGCGKSTLLSIIAGLEDKTKGKIYINNEEVNGISSRIGYMLQKDSLLEWRSIYDNVMIGLEIRKIKNKENVEYVENLLKKYNLYEFKDKYPTQLSGGMRQRAALIRTLAVRPKILLLDEAFSALDYQTRIMVTKDIYEILKNEKITTIMVTHDISESISMSDRIIVLSNRPAVIKNIHEIDFEIENRNPINCRESIKFSKYFDSIWKELEINA
ncbi:MAG: ABC transporter ATP-binding protein [Clostridia bacterium]